MFPLTSPCRVTGIRLDVELANCGEVSQKMLDMPVAFGHIIVFSARYSGTLDVTCSGPKLLT